MGLQIFYELTPNVLVEMSTVRFVDGWEYAESAETGEGDTGHVAFDDDDGSLEIVGWRRIQFRETTASPTLIGAGRVMARAIKRGDSVRASLRTGAARWWDCDVPDQNILLGARIITGSDGNRPAESAGERLRWLLGTSYLIPVDLGLVTYPTDRMDATDYRHQNAKDVLADIALPGGYNFFAFARAVGESTQLVFMLPNSTDWASTISISNDLADVDFVTCFEPFEDAELRISPERIAYGVDQQFDGGSVYVTDTATGDYYAYVDKSSPTANVKSTAKATVIANRQLAASNTEDERITIAIRVPAAQVNDLRAWHRFSLKMTHWTGWTEFRDARVLRRAVSQEPSGTHYVIRMECAPIESSETATLHYFGCPYVLDDTAPGSNGSQSYSVESTPAVKHGNIFLLGDVTSNASDYEAFTDATSLPYLTDGFCTSTPQKWGGRGPSGMYVQVSTKTIVTETPMSLVAAARSADTIVFWSDEVGAAGRYITAMSLTVDGVSVGSFSPTWGPTQWSQSDAGAIAYLDTYLGDPRQDASLHLPYGTYFDLGAVYTGTDWRMTLTTAQGAGPAVMRLTEIQAFNFSG